MGKKTNGTKEKFAGTEFFPESTEEKLHRTEEGG